MSQATKWFESEQCTQCLDLPPPRPSDLYQVLVLVLSFLLLFLMLFFFSLSFFYFSYYHIGQKSLRSGKWCLSGTKSKGSKQLTLFKKQSLCFTRIFWVIWGEHLFWKYVEKITLTFKSLTCKAILCFVVPAHCIITQWKAPGTRILRGRSNSLNQRWGNSVIRDNKCLSLRSWIGCQFWRNPVYSVDIFFLCLWLEFPMSFTYWKSGAGTLFSWFFFIVFISLVVEECIDEVEKYFHL